MNFAPFGIFGAMASSVGHNGAGVLLNLGKMILCLYGGLVVFFLMVLVPIMVYIGLSPILFIKTISTPILIAFSTASSDAALPSAMEV